MSQLTAWTLTEDYAGLRSQALGLAEAARFNTEQRLIMPRGIWRRIPAVLWPAPLRAIDPSAVAGAYPHVIIGVGGKSAAVLAALRGRARTVIVQHPRQDIRGFDLVVATRHDGLTGPNVIVTRTALHRITPDGLSAAALAWQARLGHLPRPLVAVLVGGSNGRFRLDAAVAADLAAKLAGMMDHDKIGIALTPSRRTDPAALRVLHDTLAPRGAYLWDFAGENPYAGLLALADAIVVTGDSVSMMSEAAATPAPVLIAALPGRSRRIGAFARALVEDGRARMFRGRFETWPVTPIDDTAEAAAELRRRLGLQEA